MNYIIGILSSIAIFVNAARDIYFILNGMTDKKCKVVLLSRRVFFTAQKKDLFLWWGEESGSAEKKNVENVFMYKSWMIPTYAKIGKGYKVKKPLLPSKIFFYRHKLFLETVHVYFFPLIQARNVGLLCEFQSIFIVAGYLI